METKFVIPSKESQEVTEDEDGDCNTGAGLRNGNVT